MIGQSGVFLAYSVLCTECAPQSALFVRLRPCMDRHSCCQMGPKWAFRRGSPSNNSRLFFLTALATDCHPSKGQPLATPHAVIEDDCPVVGSLNPGEWPSPHEPHNPRIHPASGFLETSAFCIRSSAGSRDGRVSRRYAWRGSITDCTSLAHDKMAIYTHRLRRPRFTHSH